MSLISQTLDNLLNGVSQQPASSRSATQSEAELNTVARRGEGLLKRPPTEHVATLGYDPVPTSAFVTGLTVSEDERFVVVIADGTIQAFDAESGDAVEVLSPQGLAYIGGEGAQSTSYSDSFTGEASGDELDTHTPTDSPAAFTWGTSAVTGAVDLEFTSDAAVGTPSDFDPAVTPIAANITSITPATPDSFVSAVAEFPNSSDRQWESGVLIRTTATGLGGYLLKVIRTVGGAYSAVLSWLAETPPSYADAFTDANNTLLTAHTSGGYGWVETNASASGHAVINSNKLTMNAAGFTRNVWLNPVWADDVDATLTFNFTGLAYTVAAGFILRGDSTSTECYEVSYQSPQNLNGTLAIRYVDANNNTSLIGDVTFAYTTATDHTLRVTLIGHEFKVYYDGVLKLTVSDALTRLDSGLAGVRIQHGGGAPVGYATIDNLTVVLPSEVELDSRSLNCGTGDTHALTLAARGSVLSARVGCETFEYDTDGDAWGEHLAAGRSGLWATKDASGGTGQASIGAYAQGGWGDAEDTTGDAAHVFRSCAIGDTTVIVNRLVTPEMRATVSPARAPEALLYVRQADYSTLYGVTLGTTSITYRTPTGSSASDRSGISTEIIAAALLDLLESASGLSDFTFEQFGSCIYITRDDGADFLFSTIDGLADNGLLAIKGTTQRFSELPAIAKNGFLVEVTGDPGTEADNYWVQYDDSDSPTNAGVWRETVKPGVLTELDDTTLPHVLVRNGSLIGKAYAAAVAEAPVVTSGGLGALIREGFEDNEWSGAGGSGNNSNEIRDEGEDMWSSLYQSVAEPTDITTYFNVDTRRCSAAQLVTVTLQHWVDGTSTAVDLATHTYSFGTNLTDESLTGTITPAVADSIRLVVTYSDPGSLMSGGPFENRATILAQGTTHTGHAGLEYANTTGKIVTFDPDGIYPEGVTITLTVQGDDVSFTTVEPTTGAAVADALTPLVEALTDITVTAIASGSFLVADVSGVPTVVAVSSWDPDTQVYIADGALIPHALIGETLENVTDESSGTVLANTVHTITVGSLTGGDENTFTVDDVIEAFSSEAGDYFVFRPATWNDREVGDEDSNPEPSFIDEPIQEVFFHEGRLGFTAGPNVLLSRSDDLFNFFRATVTALRDSDPIDITSTSERVRSFHSAISWNEDLILWSGLSQLALRGNPTITPRTTWLKEVSRYENTSTVRPAVGGVSAFYASKEFGATQVSELRVADEGLRAVGFSVTGEVPRYLVGQPLQMAALASLGVVVVLTDDDRSKLFVYCYEDSDQGRILGGWRTWQFSPDTNILGFAINGFVLSLVVEQADGVYLESLDLSRRWDGTLDHVVYLDRRGPGVSPTPFEDDDDVLWTDFTLPYALATDNSEGVVTVVDVDTGTVIESSRPTSTTVRALGTLTANDVYIGVTFSFLYRLSRLYLRRDGKAETNARLTVSWLKVLYDRTKSFVFRVAQTSRTARTRTFTSNTLTGSGSIRYPVQGVNQDVVISIEDDTPQPLCLTGLEWEGSFSPRHQRP